MRGAVTDRSNGEPLPGTFSNVEGGFGYFGSVARSTVDWQLSLVAMQDLGYDIDTSQVGSGTNLPVYGK